MPQHRERVFITDDRLITNTLDTRIEAEARGTYIADRQIDRQITILKVNGYHKLENDTCYDLKAIYSGTTRGKAERKGATPTLDHNCNIGVSCERDRFRKLTPRECFRLQGFPDEYFDRAAEVNSDSQLYKQAGNSVTVNVIYEIAKRLEGTYEK